MVMDTAFMAIDLATAVNAVSAVSVVVGVAFAVIQLRQARQERRDAAASEIVNTVQTQEVRQAIRLVLQLEPNADPARVRNDPEMLEAALAVDSACEMWGSMVFEGVVDHQMLDRMVGGWVRAAWARLRPWIESERAILDNQNVAEWWQWLVELLEADPDPGKVQGAYNAYRGRSRR
jgi:hypothetical protein